MRWFIAVFMTVYLGLSSYGALRWAGTVPSNSLRRTVLGLAALGALALPIGRAASGVIPEAARHGLVQIGEIWMALLPALVVPALIWDLFRLITSLLGKSPGPRANGRIFLVWTAASILMVTAGAGNARFPAVRHLKLEIPELSGPPIRAVLLTDLHVDSETSRTWLKRVTDSVLELSPDVILMAGDILDGSDGPALEKAAEGLAELKAPMGTYACPGNHEYYLGIDRARTIMESNGITVLMDDRNQLDHRLWIIGREDVQSARMGRPRAPLASLIPDDGLPTVVLDHTPSSIEESREAGASLVLSGHTHHGQIFPFQFVTSALFDLDWGLKRYGDTWVYVSCGVGVWGPPIRTSSRPEIVLLELSER